MELRCGLGSDRAADIDEIIGDHSETDPAFHPVVAAIAAALETMSALAHTDASLAPGAPSLPVAEPPLLLLPLARRALGRPIGNAHTFHSLGFRCGFVLGGVEAGIGSDQARCTSQLRSMHFDRRDQQVHIAGPLREDLIVNDDLVLGLLQLHQLAKLGWLTRLALADHFGRWLEQADNLALAAAVAVEDTCLGLTYNLLDPWEHLIKQLTVAFQGRLFDDLRAALHAITDLPGEAFGLSHHAAGRLQQTAIGRLQPVPARRGFAARGPGNLQHPPLHAAAPIAQLRADRTG